MADLTFLDFPSRNGGNFIWTGDRLDRTVWTGPFGLDRLDRTVSTKPFRPDCFDRTFPTGPFRPGRFGFEYLVDYELPPRIEVVRLQALQLEKARSQPSYEIRYRDAGI